MPWHNVGHLQRTHAVQEIAVGLHLPPVREIAGDDCDFRIGVMLVDIGNRSIEPRARIEPVKLESGCDQVSVGDVNEFH